MRRTTCIVCEIMFSDREAGCQNQEWRHFPDMTNSQSTQRGSSSIMNTLINAPKQGAPGSDGPTDA